MNLNLPVMKSIQVKEHGGPDKLQLVESPTPQPSAGQALVRIAASGVNFIDVYFRTGLYKADLPITLGNEGAGTVATVGSQVTDFAPGDRVAYAMTRGSYFASPHRGIELVLPKKTDGCKRGLAEELRMQNWSCFIIACGPLGVKWNTHFIVFARCALLSMFAVRTDLRHLGPPRDPRTFVPTSGGRRVHRLHSPWRRSCAAALAGGRWEPPRW